MNNLTTQIGLLPNPGHSKTETLALSHQDIRTQALNHQDIRTQPLNHQDIRTQPLNHQDIRTQALNHQDIRTQALNHQEMRTEEEEGYDTPRSVTVHEGQFFSNFFLKIQKVQRNNSFFLLCCSCAIDMINIDRQLILSFWYQFDINVIYQIKISMYNKE